MKKVCIIGVGLIGGSLGRALKAAKAAEEVVGYGRREAELAKAQAVGAVDSYSTDIKAAVQGADVVVLAIPVGAMREVLTALAPHVSDDTIITDVGSTKVSVALDADAALEDKFSNFVPGHPIAGTERSGVDASSAELFQRRRVLLTPLKETKPEAVAKVRAMWEAAGAEVLDMDVQTHDELLAATSHVPHILAYTLVDALGKLGEPDIIFQFAAGGFRDFTRIASSDPRMWTDVCVANSDAILNNLAHFSNELAELAGAIARKDDQALMTIFSRAKELRDRYAGH